MMYAMSGFGAFNADASVGCGTTANERKQIQAALNNLGFKDGSGKPLKVDGVWTDKHVSAMMSAFVEFKKKGKIKSVQELCSLLRLGSLSFAGKAASAPKPGKPKAVIGVATTTPAPQQGAPQQGAPQEGAPQEGAPQEGMSRNAKLAIAFGGLALGGLLLGSLLVRKPKAAKANKRQLGHRSPPAKHRRTGATRPSHYAWPEGYMYPIHDAKHVRSAASRFAQHKDKLPPAVRKKVAKRISQAKKRFGIGGGAIRAN